jgi:transcription elongation GreA/GreB family factor
LNKSVGDIALILKPSGESEVEIIEITFSDSPPI